MLSAAAGAYYYLRIVVVMYLRPAKEEVTLGGGWPVAVAVGVCAGLTLLLGLYSTPIAAGPGRPPTRPWTILSISHAQVAAASRARPHVPACFVLNPDVLVPEARVFEDELLHQLDAARILEDLHDHPPAPQ